jgi:putative FmdB family regulatory protein
VPTYEYQCATCDATFEVFQSIKAAPLRKAKCEACGGVQPVRRLIGMGGGILFKGSGFYQTDYRSEGYKKAAKAEKDAPSTSKDGAQDTKTGDSKAGSKKKDPAGGSEATSTSSD